MPLFSAEKTEFPIFVFPYFQAQQAIAIANGKSFIDCGGPEEERVIEPTTTKINGRVN